MLKKKNKKTKKPSTYVIRRLLEHHYKTAYFRANALDGDVDAILKAARGLDGKVARKLRINAGKLQAALGLIREVEDDFRTMRKNYPKV